eukprot:jgi/Botrbrau1/22941/Bobra.0030s0017.1
MPACIFTSSWVSNTWWWEELGETTLTNEAGEVTRFGQHFFPEVAAKLASQPPPPPAQHILAFRFIDAFINSSLRYAVRSVSLSEPLRVRAAYAVSPFIQHVTLSPLPTNLVMLLTTPHVLQRWWSADLSRRGGKEMGVRQECDARGYVFDGKPPALKKEELSRRSERKADCYRGSGKRQRYMSACGVRGKCSDGREPGEWVGGGQGGDEADIAKYSKRTVRVTQQHNDECKRLLKLMGVPYVEVYAIASEDMDSLTFATPRLVRNMMTPTTAKVPIYEYEYDKCLAMIFNVGAPDETMQVLEGLGISSEQFIDVCILCGCDLLRKLSECRCDRNSAMFLHSRLSLPYAPTRALQLCARKSFNEDRVRKTVERITSSKNKSTQGRLESFFGPVSVKSSTKRKEPEKPSKGSKPAAKKGGLGVKKKFGNFFSKHWQQGRPVPGRGAVAGIRKVIVNKCQQGGIGVRKKHLLPRELAKSFFWGVLVHKWPQKQCRSSAGLRERFARWQRGLNACPKEFLTQAA